MMFVRNIYFLAILSICKIFTSVESKNSIDKGDPFKALGIPDLNPNAILDEIEDDPNKKEKNQKTVPRLKSIEDVPNFLKNGNMNEEEGVKILTRFLIQDDFQLKKFGVVYDQTGFDGLTPGELIAPIGTEDRLMQRAKSSANIWFKEKHKDEDYDAYGANSQMDEIVPNWRIYKVLMIGKNGANTYVKVCVPLDESETALCSDRDEQCGPRTQFVEQEKKKNEDYINKIKSNNFFKKGPSSVKLLPGEKIVAKDKDKQVVLDSTTMNTNGGNLMGMYNPPQMNQANGDNLALNAFKNKNTPFMGNNPMMGMNMMNQPNMAMQGMLPNINGINPNFNLNGNMGNNVMNNMQNMGFLNSNSLSNNLSFQQQQMKGPIQPQGPSINNGQAVNQFVFKQKEQAAAVTPPQPGAIDNTQLMNELMQMKNQMAQMMQTLKQKDELINQQNLKLSQMTSQFGGVNNAAGMNNMQGVNIMNNMQAMNSMSMADVNGINNMAPMNNIQGMNNMNQMNNMNFLNGQSNPSTNAPNNNGGFPYNNFPQFKANDAPNSSFQYPSNNNNNNSNSGRRISPFLSMNLNKPF